MILKQFLFKGLSALTAVTIFSCTTPICGYAANEIGVVHDSTMLITGMKTNNLINPIGIDSENPVFSYVLCDNSVRGQKQTSYRITVADSEDKLLSGNYV